VGALSRPPNDDLVGCHDFVLDGEAKVWERATQVAHELLDLFRPRHLIPGHMVDVVGDQEFIRDV